MSENKIYPVRDDISANAHINHEHYLSLYQQSIDHPDEFWAQRAEEFVDWYTPWDKVFEWNYREGHIRWFEGATLNISYNCVDRHLQSRGDQTAIIWESDDPEVDQHISYSELHQMVCRFANVLKDRGVKKGDRISIYMPMVPEAAVAMLACTRIGAVHSIVFGGFSPDALRDRILDSDCRVVITADEGPRGAKNVPLKANVDEALQACPNVHTVLVVKRTGNEVNWQDGRDVWYHQASAEASTDCEPEHMDAEDPLFILYTSGSTGKPKGVLHTTGGYLLYGLP